MTRRNTFKMSSDWRSRTPDLQKYSRQLKAIFALEEARRDGLLSSAFVAFEMIEVIADFQEQKGDIDRLRALLGNDEEWNSTVEIPLFLLNKILEPWTDYLFGDGKTTLGKAMGVEAQASGSHKHRDVYKRLQRNIDLAQSVVLSLASSHDHGEVLSVENAIAEVSESSGVKEETVRKEFQRYAPRIRNFYEHMGVLEKVET